MSEVLANRVYDVKIAGFDDSITKMKELTSAFNKMDSAKKKLNEQLQKKIEVGDSSAVSQLTSRIKELEAQMKKLSQQKDVAAKEALLLAKADKESAQATAIRTKSLIDQDKELDRLVANEEKRAKQNANSTKAQGQNYYALAAALKQANEAYRLFDPASGDKTGFEKVKQDALEAKRKVDEFNRSLSPDGTLVGEYKTGILNAFKNLGLGDVIKKQKDDITNQLQSLIQQNRRLADQYRDTSKEGGEAFNRIEKELKENIELQERLENSLKSINTTLESTGSIGNKITRSIKDGFSGITKQATQFALGYIGFQQTIQEIQKGIADAKQIEGIEQAFKNLNKANLLDDLRLATKGTVTDLELMRKAVQANNFQIPLGQLAGYFDFARRRAKDTGESVDYLVQSIVLGIGRKSPLILDNLGISAVRLREKLKGISEENADVGAVAKAVGEIIAEENLKAGKEIDTQGEKLQQYTAKWENQRAELGTRLLPVVTFFLKVLMNLTTVIIALVSVLGLLPFPFLIVSIGYLIGLTNTWLGVKLRLITAYALEKTAMGIEIAQLIIHNTVRAIATTLTTAYAVAILRSATASGAAAIAYRVLATTLAFLASPFGLITGLVVALTTVFTLLSNKASAAGTALEGILIKQNALNAVNLKAAEISSVQISKINSWMAVIKSASTSTDIKRKALENLIAIDARFKDALDGDIIRLDKLNESYNVVIGSIQAMARAEAAKALLGDKQSKSANIETARVLIEREFATKHYAIDSRDISKEVRDIIKKLKGVDFGRFLLDPSNGYLTFDPKQFEKIKSQLQRMADAANKEVLEFFKIQEESNAALNTDNSKQPSLFERVKLLITKGGKEDEFKKVKEDIDSKKKTLNVISKDYKDLVKLEKEIDAFLNPKEKKDKDSRLTGEQKDAFKEIDAKRDTNLALAETEILEIKKVRELTYQEEINHAKKIESINLVALRGKLAILNAKKSLNAEELKVQAEFRKDIVDTQLKTQDQITSINKKAFDEELKIAEQQLEKTLRLEKSKLDAILNDPNRSFSEKAKARQDYNFFELTQQSLFNDKMVGLENKYKQFSLENENKRADGISRILKSIREERRLELDEALKDIQAQGDKAIAEFKKVMDAQRIAILQSKKSPKDKAAALGELDKQSSVGILAREIKALEDQLPILKEKLAKKQITEKEYADFYADYVKKLEQLNGTLINSQEQFTSFQQLATNKLSKLFGFGKGSENEKLLGQVISESFDLAQDALHNYFDAEERRVQKSKELAYERIDLEKKQLINKAQSEEEKESIEKQANAKKEKAEREAGEKLKKIKKAEAKISLATELAGIAASAATNPANGATFGASGAILYAILAGLAFGRYALNIKNIDTQQFAGGGKVKRFADGGPVSLSNGRITTTPNIPTQSNGDNVFATVKTGEVILNERQQKKLGGARTFAAIGVPGFASGGYTGLGNFPLGDNLKPPLNPSSFLSGSRSSSTDEMNDLKQLVAQVAISVSNTNNRIDRIKVVNDPRETVAANNKYQTASEIGTL